MIRAAQALVCFPLIAVPALSQERGVSSHGDTPAEAVPDAADEPARDKKRILHLADGSLVRARTRFNGQHWEVIEALGEWRELPGAVVRALDERSLLAQARKLETGVGEDPARRVALADWMAQQGLVGEAVDEINRVLAAEPDHAPARALALRLAPRLRVSALDSVGDPSADAVSSLLASVANSSPAVQELAIDRIGAMGPQAEPLRVLRENLVSHSPRARALAALAMRRLFPAGQLAAEDLAALIQRSVLDGSDGVRAEAGRALRDAGNPRVIVPAVRALASSNGALRENAAQALGNMAYPEAVEPLIAHLSNLAAAQSGGTSGNPRGSIFIGKQSAYIQDFDVEVAQFQAVADPQINVLIEGSVLDARVIGSSVTSIATEARTVRRSLEQLTGESFGGQSRSWLQWWERNKQRWVTRDAESGRTRSQ